MAELRAEARLGQVESMPPRCCACMLLHSHPYAMTMQLPHQQTRDMMQLKKASSHGCGGVHIAGGFQDASMQQEGS